MHDATVRNTEYGRGVYIRYCEQQYMTDQEVGARYGVVAQLDDHFACPSELAACSAAKMATPLFSVDFSSFIVIGQGAAAGLWAW